MRKLLCLLFLSSFYLCSCDNEHDSKFPGFIGIDARGQENTYLYDPSSIRSVREGKTFKFIKKLRDGYVIQDAITNCNNAVEIYDGTFYSYKGGQQSVSPGTIITSLEDDLLLKELVTKICEASNPPSITATGINFNLVKEYSLNQWNDPSLTPDQINAETFYETEKTVQKDAFKINLVNIFPREHTCHACNGITAAFVWQKENGKWKPVQEELRLSDLSQGGFANPPKLEWVEKDNNELLALYGSSMHQGYLINQVDVFLLTKKGLERAENDPNLVIESKMDDYIEREEDYIFEIVAGEDKDEFKLVVQGDENGENIRREYAIDVSGDGIKYTGEVDQSSKDIADYNKKPSITVLPENRTSGFLMVDVDAQSSLDDENTSTKKIKNGSSVIITGVTSDHKKYEIEYGSEKEKLYVPMESIAVFSD